jgi:tripartite-type tricarboxylate transporter receptor subunit TctC
MMTKQAIWLRLGLVLFATTALCGAVFAQNAADEFYRGRQINLIIGYGPGGGYDMVGRLLARHLGRYLPGHPTIVAQNMPGAGSLRAVNYLYSIAPRDGTTFGLFGSDMALIGLIGGNSNIQFDPRKFTWLGSSSSFAGDAYVLMVRPGAHAKSIAEARRENGPPLVLAGTGEGARDADVPKILRDALALNIKPVLGYPDTPSIFLAVERGEVDGRTFDFSSVKSNKPQWLRPESGFHILVQFARATRHPELADVPTARELATGAARRAGRPRRGAACRVPRGTPRSSIPCRSGETRDISPLGADDVMRGIERMAHGPPDALDYMRRLFAGHKGG